jgi:hypothetical protein
MLAFRGEAFLSVVVPLRENTTRVLAENLAILVPTERVLQFPWGE